MTARELLTWLEAYFENGGHDVPVYIILESDINGIVCQFEDALGEVVPVQSMHAGVDQGITKVMLVGEQFD